MKKIFFWGLVMIIVTLTGCKKDEEQSALQFKFDVTVPTEKIETGLGTNDIVPLEFVIKRAYASGAEMTFSVISDKKNFTLTNAKGEELEQNQSYKITDDKLILNYKGLEQGTHNIQIDFKNDKNVVVSKKVTLTFVNYEFSYVVNTEKKEIYQGEETNYTLDIESTNLNAGAYFIKFTSYEEQDKNLEKSNILFEGEKIVFEKWYELKNLTGTKIDILSFYTGDKQLRGIIKNKNVEKYFELRQSVRNRSIAVSTSDVSQTAVTQIGEIILYKALIEKKPTKLTDKIWYKTWLTINANAPEDGLTTTKNEYVEYTLTDTGYFEIPIETKKGGVYQYNIQFKDEFGNESSVDSKNITVDNKDFNIHLRQDYTPNDVYQGQELVHLIQIEQLQNVTNENYQLRFLSFEEKDMSLADSKILYRQNDVNKNEVAFQMNQWKSLSGEDVRKGFFVVLNSFYSGIKKIKFEIKNSQKTKTYEFQIDVKQLTYDVSFVANKNKLVAEEQVEFSVNVSVPVNISNNKFKYEFLRQGYQHYQWVDGMNFAEEEFFDTTPTNNVSKKYRTTAIHKGIKLNNSTETTTRVKVRITDNFNNVVEKYVEFVLQGVKLDRVLVSDVQTARQALQDYKGNSIYRMRLTSANIDIRGQNITTVYINFINRGVWDILGSMNFNGSFTGRKNITSADTRALEEYQTYLNNKRIPYTITIKDSSGNIYEKQDTATIE